MKVNITFTSVSRAVAYNGRGPPSIPSGTLHLTEIKYALLQEQENQDKNN